MPKNTDTRKQLIESATILFYEKNYDSVSVREICKHAKTTSNMVNYYFGSKERLYNEILSEFSVEVFTKPVKLLQRKPKSTSDVVTTLEIFIDQTLDAIIAQRKQYELVRREKKNLGVFTEYSNTLVEYLEQAKCDGYVRKQLDPEMLTGLIVGRLGQQVADAEWINHVTGTDIISDAEYRKRWVAANIDIFLYGIVQDT